MKKGCLLIFAVFVLASFSYYSLARGSVLQHMWWVAILLGLSTSLALGSVLGLLQAFKQRLAARRPVSQWRDGDLVAFSGALRAQRRALLAPFSGKAAVMVQYEIKRAGFNRSDDSSSSSFVDYCGFLMTPCQIHTQRGAMRLVGFPLLHKIKAQDFSSDMAAAYRRAADFLFSTEFTPRAAGVMKAIAELNSVLNDEDGEIKANFWDPKGTDYVTNFDQLDADIESVVQKDPASDVESLARTKLPVQKIAEQLSAAGCGLEEQLIPDGAEVTVIGTYLAAKSQINIGSGLKNLEHQIQLGKLSEVLGKNFRAAVLSLLFWGGVWAAANCYFLQAIGIDLKALLFQA